MFNSTHDSSKDNRKRQSFNVELRKKKVVLGNIKNRLEFLGDSTHEETPVKDSEEYEAPDLARVIYIAKQLNNYKTLDNQTIKDFVLELKELARNEDNNDLLIYGGVIDALLTLCRYIPFDKIDFSDDILWILANISAGTSVHTAAVVQAGTIDVLVGILHPNVSPATAECIAFILANIAGDDSSFRMMILNSDAHTFFLRYIESIPDHPFIEDEQYKELVKNVSWLISNICRVGGNYRLHYETFQIFIPFWLRIFSIGMPGTFHVLWSLVFCSGACNDAEAYELYQKFSSYVVDSAFSYHESSDSKFAAVRVIGNLSATSTSATAFVQSGLLGRVVDQLANHNLNETFKRYIRELLWCLSNIFSSSDAAILNQAVVEAPDVILHIIRLMKPENPPNIRTEACWCTANIILKLTNDLLWSITSNTDIIATLIEFKDFRETSCVELCVEALAEIFSRLSDDEQMYDFIMQAFIQNDGENMLEVLTYHRSSHVREIIDRLKSYVMQSDEPDSDFF